MDVDGLTDDARFTAEESDGTYFQGTNCIETPSKLTEVQPATPAVLEHQLRPFVQSPTEIEGVAGQNGDSIESLPIDTQAGAAEAGTTWPRVLPIESIGSHLNPQAARFAQSSHPGDASEDEWPVSDTEACSPTTTDRSRTVSAPTHS